MNRSAQRRRSRREAMSKVDTAWLRMERPSNPMMITGVLMFNERMDIQRLRRLVTQRFLAYERFTQKPVETAAGAFWKTDSAFDDLPT